MRINRESVRGPLDLRVIHLPLNVGNNVYPLSLGLRRIGIKSDCLVLAPHSFGYPYDFDLSNGGRRGKFLIEVARIHWLLRIIKNYNTIHFNFGSTLAARVGPNVEWSISKKILHFPYVWYLNLFQITELWIYKVRRIRMFVHYQGDDARQGAAMQGLKYSLLQGATEGYYSEKTDKFKSKQIRRIGAYAEKIYYVNPDLGALLPIQAQFIPYSHIDIQEYEFSPHSPSSSVVKIVHAPSNRGIKGTKFVVDTLERLTITNPNIQFELIENLPHELALKKYREADLVIDQMLGGWYGGLAVEALALGVPVMCYLREEDFKNLNQEMLRELPIINVTTQNLEERILEFITFSDSDISDLRKRCRAFVEKWHNVDSICNRISADYLKAHETKKS
jgi:hypothetical protein